jgi:predicted nucleic acid-binding protein
VRVLVDTSVLIDHLRGDRRAVGLLAGHAQAADELWSVTPVRTEILAGQRRGEEAATRALLDSLQWLDVTVEVADRAGAMAARFLASHRNIDTIDYLIAAGAEFLGARLLTQNVRHFPMIKSLQPAYR